MGLAILHLLHRALNHVYTCLRTCTIPSVVFSLCGAIPSGIYLCVCVCVYIRVRVWSGLYVYICTCTCTVEGSMTNHKLLQWTSVSWHLNVRVECASLHSDQTSWSNLGSLQQYGREGWHNSSATLSRWWNKWWQGQGTYLSTSLIIWNINAIDMIKSCIHMKEVDWLLLVITVHVIWS